MTEDQLKEIAENIKKYNETNKAKPGHTSYTEIVEFIQYPEARKNGAVLALKFKSKWQGKETENIIEYNSPEQLLTYLRFHA